jgi:micrococcal nuclease
VRRRWDYDAYISRQWTDGDTVRVDIDYGMDKWHKNVKLRLARIDAYAAKSELGKAATAFCTRCLPLGTRFTLVTVQDKTEKWGRYLAEVFIDNPDGTMTNLNDQLVLAGLAKYWDGQGPHPTGEGIIL